MREFGLLCYGAAMAALFGMGGTKLIYGEIKAGLPMFLAGIALYAGIWWDI